MSSTKDFIQVNRAALFDWMVFTISFSLGFMFPTLKDFASSPGFSYWMLSAAVLYTTGAWLKHLPLYYRLNTSGDTGRRMPYAFFLAIGHWCILLMVVIFSISAIRKMTGFSLADEKDGTNGTIIFAAIFIAAFITWLVFRSNDVLKKRTRYSLQYLFRRELAGDICLLTAVSIFSFVFWEKGIIALLSNKPVHAISDVWFLFVFLAFAYMLCYLPLRYLFLVEDHFSSKTWRRMLIIFALLLIRSLFEIMNR